MHRAGGGVVLLFFRPSIRSLLLFAPPFFPDGDHKVRDGRRRGDEDVNPDKHVDRSEDPLRFGFRDHRPPFQ